MSLKVFLVGEGQHDIGRWETDEPYRAKKTENGVLGTLAHRQVTSGWQIHDGCAYRRLPVLGVGRGLEEGERKRFAGALQRTREAECDVLIYGRDTDGNDARTAVLTTLRDAHVGVALAVVEPCIEGWVLELRGDRKKKGWSKVGAQEALGSLSTPQMEAIVAAWDGKTEPLSDDLKRWLDDVKRVLSPTP